MMRVIVVLLLAARVAHAGQSIVVLSNERALAPAMQIALSGRGVAIATSPAPSGELRLERAAAAQRAALQLGADAAVWIDRDGSALDVCAVTADGRGFRHAPMPPDLADATARAFSAIATSLLDELVASPEPMPNIDVEVNVHVTPNPRVAVAEPVRLAPPIAVEATPAPVPAPLMRDGHTLIELGPMASPLTLGIEGGLAIPVTQRYRLALTAGMGELMFDSDHDPVYWGTAEVRHVGLGEDHFDYGFVGGAVTAQSQPLGFAGMRFAYTFEGPSTGVSFSIAPVIATDGKAAVPAAYASIHWELPL